MSDWFWAASAVIGLLALMLERFAGYPNLVYAAIGHPVVWVGRAIADLDDRFNPEVRPAGRAAGILALGALLTIVLAVTLPPTLILRMLPGGFILEAMLASSLLSQSSLYTHVARVAEGLDSSLAAGREAVSHIVGRDPQALNESDVSRAAIESLAENASDGVTAPLLWLVLGGLPGAALYKAINTADSMIGHRSERHLRFGWASARLDDLVNLVPARLTGILIALAATRCRPGGFRNAMRAMGRDASRHQSPNAGWPEAAMAGSLGIRLGGPRSYEGERVELAWMGDGREELTRGDIRDGLAIYRRMLWLLAATAAMWATALLLNSGR